VKVRKFGAVEAEG